MLSWIRYSEGFSLESRAAIRASRIRTDQLALVHARPMEEALRLAVTRKFAEDLAKAMFLLAGEGRIGASFAKVEVHDARTVAA